MECPPDPFIERVETAAKSRTGSIDLEATVLLAITAKAIWEAFFKSHSHPEPRGTERRHREKGGGRDNWENCSYFVSSPCHLSPCCVDFITERNNISQFYSHFFMNTVFFLFRNDDDWILTSLRRDRKCNRSNALLSAFAVPRYSDHVFFLLFGLKFTFLFSEASECTEVCYITLGSIKPVKSLLYDFPNVTHTKERHPALYLVFIQQQWLVLFQDLGFLHFKGVDKWKKNVLS